MKENAYEELVEAMQDGEFIEAIIFGPWGNGYNEPDVPLVPEEKQGVVLSAEEAAPLMEGWSLFSGYGSPECYAMSAWTNERIFWITQYDGRTTLSSAPRNPKEGHIPYMPGNS